MHGFGDNIIFFPVENIYWKFEVIVDIKENGKKISLLHSIKTHTILMVSKIL